MNKALNKFQPQYIGIGECEDPYIALCFADLRPYEADFMALSQSLLQPVVAVAEEVQHADA